MISRQRLIEAFSSNAIKVAYGIVMMTFITRQFPIEETGSYFLVVAIMTLLSDWKEGFFLSGFIKYIVEEKEDAKVISTGLLLSLAWDVLNIGLFLVATFWFQQLSGFFVAYVLMVVLSSLSRWITYIHRSRLATDVLFQSNLISLAAVLMGIGVIYLGSLPIEYCLVVLGGSNFLPCLLLKKNLVVIQQTLADLRFDRASYHKLKYFGKYGVLLAITGSLSHQSGIFLSAQFLDLTATALLGLGSRYAMLLSIPGNSISTLLYPEVLKCSTNRDKIKDVAHMGLSKMYGILIPIALLTIIGSPLGIVILHGREYLFVATIITFKTISLLINLPLSTAYTSVMNTLNQPEKVTRLVMLNSIVNLILIAPMMYFWGVWGALIAPFLIEVIGYAIMRKGLRLAINLELSAVPQQVMHYWRYWIQRYHIRPLITSNNKKVC